MGVAEGASGASADAPGVGLELVSVSFSHEKKGEKNKNMEKKGTFKIEKEGNRKGKIDQMERNESEFKE